MPDNTFSKDDLSLLGNSELLVQKRVLQDKIYDLLDDTRKQLESNLTNFNTSKFPKAKISRGENYMSLPYLILDFPSSFNDQSTLACRTMFLWGHFFSTTIHFQGDILEQNRTEILKTCQELNSSELFISCGETPWQYHYNSSNYIPLNSDNIDSALKNDFFKLSRKIALDKYHELPHIALQFYNPFTKIINKVT